MLHHRDVARFPPDVILGIQIMSNQLNLPQVDSNQVVGISALIIYLFLISKKLFLLCHYGVLCVD